MNIIFIFARRLNLILRKLYYLNKVDIFSKISKLTLNHYKSKDEHPLSNVLIIPFRITPVSNTFEGLFSFYLMKKGYSPIFLLCGQGVTSCDNYTNQQSRVLKCNLCLSEQKVFSQTFPGKYYYIDDLIDPFANKELYRLSRETTLTEMLNYNYKGVFIREHLLGGLQRFYLKGHLDLEINIEKVRDVFFTCIKTAEATIILLNKHKIEFSLLSHGIYSTWGTVLETLKFYNIKSIVWGRGYKGGEIVLANNDTYLVDSINEPKEVWDNFKYGTVQRNKIIKYFHDKSLGKNNNVDHVTYYNKSIKMGSTKETFLKLNLNMNQNIFGLYPNIFWDGQVFNKSEAFPSLIEWVYQTIAWFINNPKEILIIRSHPAELKRKERSPEKIKDLILSKYKKLPSNIIIIEPNSEISSYEVAEITKVDIVYGTSLGVELVAKKKPVIMCGNFYYKGKGFTFDPESLNEYYSMLELGCNNKLILSEEMYEVCLKYSYHYFFRRHFPETIIDLEGLNPIGLKINSVGELISSENKVYASILESITQNKPFIWNSHAN